MAQEQTPKTVVVVLLLGMTRRLEGNLEACEKELAPQIPFYGGRSSGQKESCKEEGCPEEEEGCKEEGRAKEEACHEEEEEVACF